MARMEPMKVGLVAAVVYPRLGVKAGDPLTLTTIQGASATGEVVEVDEDEGGGVRAVALRDDPNRPDPVWIRGDLIAMWRLGEAVRVPVVGQNGIQQFPMTPEMLRNLRGQ
jgi:hypothetical protein